MGESVAISLAGGAFGLLLATWTLKILYPIGLSFVPEEWGTVVLDLTPDLRVFAYTLGLACVAGVLVGLAPSLQSSALNLNASLQDGGAMIGLGVRPARLRSALWFCRLQCVSSCSSVLDCLRVACSMHKSWTWAFGHPEFSLPNMTFAATTTRRNEPASSIARLPTRRTLPVERRR